MLRVPLHQRGASLIVALIFLLVLTAAGLTAVRFATLEERMASNTQFRGMAHQLTQSEMRAQLRRFNTSAAGRASLLNAQNAAAHGLTADQLTNLALPDTSRLPVALDAEIDPADAEFSQHSVRFLSQRICEDGSSGDKFSCTYYEVATTARMDGGAESSQTQGIVFMSNQ
ncbi:MAG TPA: PilX N-terminal domain-containing pilus assembly protein [Pseudomonas sp.]|jgi:Tfp pilus assembly protein PilX|uniref:pilus assembly PilX family protein n=1 Tax=Pseudomonas sp. TaxID=306 RepID=UPI002C49C9DC|nr:PilX N-terminal domain-containing pilus assembly protein [Pseudomonas sp.]HTO19477.1 PilX N-terminal domain-containing pilus assembly protein [Pseudomonas sp.]